MEVCRVLTPTPQPLQTSWGRPISLKANEAIKIWRDLECCIADVLKSESKDVCGRILQWVQEEKSLTSAQADPRLFGPTLPAAILSTGGVEWAEHSKSMTTMLPIGYHTAVIRPADLRGGYASVGGAMKLITTQFLVKSVENPDLDATVSLRDARDLKHLAVLVEDADSCHRLALQKLLSILCAWSTKLPLVLLLSVETPGASFRSFIGSKAPPAMKLKQFLLPSTRQRCDAVVKAALLEGDESLHLWAGGLALLNCEASLPALLHSIRIAVTNQVWVSRGREGGELEDVLKERRAQMRCLAEVVVRGCIAMEGGLVTLLSAAVGEELLLKFSAAIREMSAADVDALILRWKEIAKGSSKVAEQLQSILEVPVLAEDTGPRVGRGARGQIDFSADARRKQLLQAAIPTSTQTCAGERALEFVRHLLRETAEWKREGAAAQMSGQPDLPSELRANPRDRLRDDCTDRCHQFSTTPDECVLYVATQTPQGDAPLLVSQLQSEFNVEVENNGKRKGNLPDNMLEARFERAAMGLQLIGALHSKKGRTVRRS